MTVILNPHVNIINKYRRLLESLPEKGAASIKNRNHFKTRIISWYILISFFYFSFAFSRGIAETFQFQDL